MDPVVAWVGRFPALQLEQRLGPTIWEWLLGGLPLGLVSDRLNQCLERAICLQFIGARLDVALERQQPDVRLLAVLETSHQCTLASVRTSTTPRAAACNRCASSTMFNAR